MASPAVGTPNVRKKRNFKALQLDVAETPVPAPAPVEAPLPVVASLPPGTRPASSRAAPGAPGGGRKKPPTMDLSKSKGAAAAGTGGKPGSLAGAGSNSATTSGAAQRSNYHTTLSEQIATLDITGSHPRLDLRQEDLRPIGELGQGNGGTVNKVMHLPTKTIMAKKVVLIDAKPAVRKQILRELQIMHHCHSQYIVSFHGAFVADPHICICMEYMDKGSWDGIYKKNGPINIEIVGKIAYAVLEGLTYLYDVHRIIHRDIKPSNMLFNSKGEIKICDFGVSGELINSIADTFVGTSTYMSPERIQGAQYTVKSDVWSTGISLIELALGRFPFAEEDGSDSDFDDLADLQGTLSPAYPHEGLPPPRVRNKTKDAAQSKKDKRKSKGVSLQGGGMTMSILELLQHIVNEPAPRLTPTESFPKESHEFLDACLRKEPEKRLTPKELLRHDWMVMSVASKVDLQEWAKSLL
ncbi:MAP kinase kinase (MEK) [Tulasnella sp. 331]|nr:MAP kinase kinase (MEK) [Tulasnella sp. 331]KAG8887279.1 MAP kinase kinase (MEK) [Tulasnella sp. 332]